MNFFPDANFTGQIYNVSGALYLVREPIQIENLEGEIEWGWDANNLSKEGAPYHFFTETEIKNNNYVIQKY